MKTAQCKQTLLDFLSDPNRSQCRVVVMPDFFLDRLITLPWSPEEFCSKVKSVAKRKGGSLDGIPQVDMAGGNAVNVASALSRLDAAVTPIICTSHYGLEQIKYHFQNRPLDYSHIKTIGDASSTTALEFRQENGKSNVMMRNLGALADFGPENLTEGDYKLIEAADYVCLFNWAGTLNHGTELAQEVFGAAKRGKCRTYYDTADPNPHAAQIPDLIKRVLKTALVDVLSLNENEAVTYASQLEPDFKTGGDEVSLPDLALQAARLLAQRFHVRVDLHTTDFSATINGASEAVVPSFKVKPLRATGAGDSWCAGNVLASHFGLPDESRLMLANAVAACYLQSVDGAHPTKNQLISFLQRQL